MNQPKFQFGEEVEYSSIKFTIYKIEYRDATGTGRPTGFYYQDHREVWHHEGALKKYIAPAKPISVLEFNHEWQRLYGCTWDNAKSGRLYTGMVGFLKEKKLIV